MSFEKDLEKLEKLVNKLESETLSIDESLKLYNEAITAGKNCIASLGASRGKLELLNKDLSRIDLDGEADSDTDED